MKDLHEHRKKQDPDYWVVKYLLRSFRTKPRLKWLEEGYYPPFPETAEEVSSTEEEGDTSNRQTPSGSNRQAPSGDAAKAPATPIKGIPILPFGSTSKQTPSAATAPRQSMSFGAGYGRPMPPKADATDAEKAKYFDMYIQSLYSIPNQTQEGARIFSTGTEMRLKAPETGKSWADIDVWNILVKFKENISIMGKTDDLLYRISHMDEAWITHLNNSLFELEFRKPPVVWKDLNDKEFFHECDKVFGKIKLASSSIHYASNTLFTEKYNEWLNTEYSDGEQLWTGNYEYDKERCTCTLSTYNLLTTQYPLSEQEKTPEYEAFRLSDMRRAIHKAACKEYNSTTGGTAKQAPLHFMI